MFAGSGQSSERCDQRRGEPAKTSRSDDAVTIAHTSAVEQVL
jgi:hypothetical protein